jgi:hypothetical protein
MKTRHIAVVALAASLGLCGSVACGTTGNAGIAFASTHASVDGDLAGTWEYVGGDGGGQQKITLILRSDQTYTKTLDATVNGAHYGGTHSGTWTSEGMTVRLSGDGNWPPYTHDLSAFRKVR